MKEPELAGEMQSQQAVYRIQACIVPPVPEISQEPAGKNIKHLLVQILGREEVPDVRHSLWNRVRAGR